ncbi:MAG: hypothetical protein JW726_05295 [Anaerolineales bacterium]|nr:hypothetical protein [Anaerolineales bacterium]
MAEAGNFRIEKLPDEPIVLEMVGEHLDFTRDIQALQDGLRAMLDETSEPLYAIADISKLDNFTIRDMVDAANSLTRGRGSTWKHPNLKEIMFVSTNSTIRLAAQGLSSPVFGGFQIKVFQTLEDALVYVRGQIASS